MHQTLSVSKSRLMAEVIYSLRLAQPWRLLMRRNMSSGEFAPCFRCDQHAGAIDTVSLSLREEKDIFNMIHRGSSGGGTRITGVCVGVEGGGG